MNLRTVKLTEFVEWFDELDTKGRAQVDARILKIEVSGYFGDAKELGDGLAELRWKSGRRVYFARIRDLSGSLVISIRRKQKWASERYPSSETSPSKIFRRLNSRREPS